MRRCLVVGGLVLGSVLPSGAQPRVQYAQEVDRTALYAGDRFRYSVTVTVPPGAHVAIEDFDRKNINFNPLVPGGMTTATTTLADGTVRHRFEYLLSNYETGDKSIELPRIIFRWQPAGQGGTERSAAEEMAVPAFPLAIRSTLNQKLEDSWIQESLPTAPLPGVRWYLVIIGALGLLVSSLPAWSWLRSEGAAWRARRRRPSRRVFLDRWGRALEDLERTDSSVDIKTRSLALETLALDYARESWQVRAAGLTPEELRTELAARHVSPDVQQVLEAAVDHAQKCRYAPADGGTWEEDFRLRLSGLKTLAA